MLDYLYDGSFEGFLTCIYEHYYNEKASGIYRSDAYQASLLVACRTVKTEENKATRVYDAIEKKISREDMKRVYRAFLASAEEKENKLLQYLRLGFQKGSAVSLLHSDPIVFEVQQIEKKVTVEMHRLKGLVRFSALVKQAPGLKEREILYCKVEPDHDVLEIIADHFADRLKSDPFIIHDKIRNKAVIAQGGSWYIAAFTDADLPGLGELERDYRDLWKRYFETIAIQERINPACQKRMMPVRYWKNLTEFR